MKIAVVSDIHGNLRALEAVIADMQRTGVDRVINLGDLLSGPLEPAETADLLMALHWPTLCGNHERQLLACAQGGGGHSDRFAFKHTTAAHRDWLAALPATLTFAEEGVYACHGAPGDDLRYFLEHVGAQGVELAAEQQIAAAAHGISASLLLCGHSHLPRVVALPDGRLIVNPGSVGLPAYDDDYPYYHRVENGSPHARYAVCERADGGWHIDLRAVPYDFQAAARVAEAHGAPAWARWLSSGRAAQ